MAECELCGGEGVDCERCANARDTARRFVTVDDTTWPIEVGDLAWVLRYGMPVEQRPEVLTRQDRLILASVVESYLFLIDPTRPHKEAVASLRRARKAAGRD